MGPVVKEHCDQLELQLLRLCQLVSQGNGSSAKFEKVLPKFPRLLTRLESTPLLPNQQRKNGLEQLELNFSPINEPKSMQRSLPERQSQRAVKANILTNGTLNYCSPRLARKTDSSIETPRFTTEFSLRDLSRNLHQEQQQQSSLMIKSATCDSKLSAELEEILAQLDKLFPNDEAVVPSAVNATLIKATNHVADVLAEFVDAFHD